MSAAEERMIADRLLRDAALTLVKADVGYIKSDVAERGIGGRISDRASEGTVDLLEQAVELADDNRGALAALIGAVVLWFARNPIIDLLFGQEGEDDAPRSHQTTGRNYD